MAGGRVGTRKADRFEAFGRAVPEGTKIGVAPESFVKEGDGPALPALASATGSSGVGMEIGDGRQVTGVGDGDIAEFMDLDKIEDGFARNFIDGGGGRV